MFATVSPSTPAASPAADSGAPQLAFTGGESEVLAYVDNVFDDATVQSSGGGPGLGCCFVLGSSLDFPTQNVPQDAVMVDLPLYRSAFLCPPRVFGVRANYRFGGS